MGPTTFPYPLSDDYTGDLPGAHTILSDEYKRRVPHTNWYPEDMTNIGDLRGRKAWYIMSTPGRFLENIGTHIFFKKGVPHTTRQLSSL